MARTKGAKGRRRAGPIRVTGEQTLVPINLPRIQALLAGSNLLTLAKRGADRSQLQRLRAGRQHSLRYGRLKLLASLLGVRVDELRAEGNDGETMEAYRLDVVTRALARDVWEAAGEEGEPPFWLSDLLRSLLDHDTWRGAFQDGGTPILTIDAKRGGRARAKALARVEARRREFCDQMAALIRLVLPTEADRKAGIRISSRRAGALLLAFRDLFMTRLHGVSRQGTTMTRKAAAEAATQVLRQHRSES